MEEELADVVIRCLDLAGLRGWDLQDTLDNVDELNDVSDFFQEHTFVEIVLIFAPEQLYPNLQGRLKE